MAASFQSAADRVDLHGSDYRDRFHCVCPVVCQRYTGKCPDMGVVLLKNLKKFQKRLAFPG